MLTNKVVLDDNLTFFGSGNWYVLISELIAIIDFFNKNGLHGSGLNTGDTRSEKR